MQDAFSSKYKSAVHTGVFENAVKRYRQKTKNQSKRKMKKGISEKLTIPVGVSSSDIEESSARAQQNLEYLPGEVLEQARIVHRYVRCLVQAEPGGNDSADLQLLLDDINRTQESDEKVKMEILHDKDARNVSIDPSAAIPLIEIEKSFLDALDAWYRE